MFDFKERERISFYQNMLYGLENYCSSNDEVNQLLNELYQEVFKLKYKVDKFKTDCNIELKKDVKRGKSIIREVYIGDLILNTIFAFLHETVSFNKKDKITDLISKIYNKLDTVVYPYQKDNDSDIDVKNYVELIYEEDK